MNVAGQNNNERVSRTVEFEEARMKRPDSEERCCAYIEYTPPYGVGIGLMDRRNRDEPMGR